MNPNITKIIDQYLSGELSPEDAKYFEERLANSAELRQQLELQRDIIDGAKRAERRARVKQKAKKYHVKKLVRWGSLSAVILAIATAATLYITSSIDEGNTPPEISKELISELDKKAQIDNLETQYFAIPENGKVVLSEDGVLLSVPKKAFMLNGKPYVGQVVVQYQEAISGEDIVKAGLNTMSGDQLLETQGMFGISGFTPEGEQLEFNPKVGVYVQTPVDEYKDKMQLFDGAKKADGSIDWVDPEPLEKIPVPVDMSKLNFYPVGYEDLLDELKWKQSKESRDSLYLSFEESYCGNNDEGDAVEIVQEPTHTYPETERWFSGEELFKMKCATCHMVDKDGTGPALQGVRDKWRKGGAQDGSIYQWVKDWKLAAANDSYAFAISKVSSTSEVPHPELSNEEINRVFDYADRGLYYGDDTTVVHDASAVGMAECMDCQKYILPSNVLGFWNKKFNNTNLATHEFEKRMRAIHSTCDNSVLKKYTKQLSKSISKIDAEVAAMGHPEFEEFAAEHVGAVNPNNPHIKGLQDFYEKGIEKLKKRNQILQKEEQKRRKKWDKGVSKERSKEAKRKVKRETQALNDEYEYNLDQVYQQLGRTQGFTVRHGGGVIKNVDAYVWEATVNRKTTEITDPFTGKKAKITYNKFTMNVENPEKYIKLYAYLFPNNIKSYQRIDATGGKFDYPLNDFFIYDVCVVGITEDGYEYFQKMTLNSGELGTVKMEKVTEAKLDASVKQLNSKRGGRPMEIDTEMDWLIKEREDYKEQKMRRKMYEFRNKIQDQIFPCCPAAKIEYASEVRPDYGIGM